MIAPEKRRIWTALPGETQQLYAGYGFASYLPARNRVDPVNSGYLRRKVSTTVLADYLWRCFESREAEQIEDILDFSYD
jgi:hypothetical protein